MPDTDLDALRDRLLRGGIAPRYVERAVSELRDHLEDIEFEIAESGLSRTDSWRLATERIGSVESITEQYSNKPRLRHWSYRHPRLARVLLPVAYVLLLPAVPVHAGIENAPIIARWCASLLLGAFVTVTMLLVMYLSILLA